MLLLIVLLGAGMAYTSAMWKEDKKKQEFEEVIPTVWIRGNIVHYLRNKIKRHRDSCEEPDSTWSHYQLKKTKHIGKHYLLNFF